MAIQLAGTQLASSATTTTHSIDTLDGIDAGTLLLLQVWINSNTATVTSMSVEWELVAEIIVGASQTHQIYARVATDSEPASYSVTRDGGTIQMQMALVGWYSDVGWDLAVDAHSTNTTTGTTRTWASVTTTVDNAVLNCFGTWNSLLGTTPQEGMTEQWDATAHYTTYLMTQTLGAAGATGERTATSLQSVTSPNIAVAVAEIEPAISGYAVANGHSVSVGDLERISPQPSSSGVKVTRRNHSANRSVQDESLYAELEFNVLGSATMYRAVLEQFGVKDALLNDVTITVRDATLTWKRYNGTAVRPAPNWRGYFPRNIVILIKNLVELA